MISRHTLVYDFPFFIRSFIFDEELVQWLNELVRSDHLNLPTISDSVNVVRIRRRLDDMLADSTFLDCHDDVFALQMQLAKAYPILVERSPNTGEFIVPDAPLIFFSDGGVYHKKALQCYYQLANSYNDMGEYLDLDGLPISEREIVSLQQQGISFIEEPSTAEKIGVYIFGKFIGSVIIGALYTAAFIFMPVLGLATAGTIGLASIASVWAQSQGNTRASTYAVAFLAGVTIVALAMTAASLLFPPLALALVSVGLISSGAAASAAAFFATFIVPSIPLVVGLGGLIVSRIKNIPFSEVVYAGATAPYRLIMYTMEKTFGMLGRALNWVGKGLGILPSLPPRPPVVEQPVYEAADAPLNETETTYVINRFISEMQASAAQPQQMPDVVFDEAPIQAEPGAAALAAVAQPTEYSGRSFKLTDECNAEAAESVIAPQGMRV